jgi:hypothetical protein
MRRSRRRVLGTAVAVLVLAFLAATGASAATGEQVSVSMDRQEVSTKLGKKFVFHSILTNRGSTATGPLIAHLNVLSYGSSVYVDPEDWSSNRVRYLAPIPAGGSTRIAWRIEGVNAGKFAVYVSVLPNSASLQAPASGPTLHVKVTQRRTLNSGGILPLALGIPGFLGLLALGFRVRRTGPLALRRRSA